MNKPKYRFKRENGTDYPEWLHTNMGELYSERKETGRDDLPILSVSIHTGISDGELDEDELGKRIKRCADLSSYKITENGDLVFNMMRAWQGAVGCSTCNGMVSPAYIVAKPDPRIYPEYMNYYVQTHRVISEFNKLSYEVMDFRKRLYWDSFVDASVNLPCLEEQQKIANFLSNVDEVISQSEAEVANLEQQKKVVLQKIFSQEIRFKFENGTEYPDWKETTIGKYCDILDNLRKPISKADREAGIYPYYGATNIQDYISDYIFDEPLVLLGEDGAPFMDFNNKPIAQLATGKYWVNNHAHCLRPHGNVVFFFYSVVHKDIREYVNNPERAKLNQEDMVRIPILLPCEEEQQKISNFLSSYDASISYAKQELEHWKQLKKGLLQQMFV